MSPHLQNELAEKHIGEMMQHARYHKSAYIDAQECESIALLSMAQVLDKQPDTLPETDLEAIVKTAITRDIRNYRAREMVRKHYEDSYSSCLKPGPCWLSILRKINRKNNREKLDSEATRFIKSLELAHPPPRAATLNCKASNGLQFSRQDIRKYTVKGR